LRSGAGIAKFLTLLAKTFSKVDGSDVALKPRWTSSIALTSARIAIADSKSREFFQRFIVCRLLSARQTMVVNQTLRVPENSVKCCEQNLEIFRLKLSNLPVFVTRIVLLRINRRSQIVGSLERPERAVDQIVFDPDDNSERCDFNRPRPNASRP
jgi:hypothetical protein